MLGVGQRRQSRRHGRWRADDVVASRSFVQTAGDDRPDTDVKG